MKLNVLLAQAEHAAVVLRENIKDYISFFKRNQGAFQGIRKTHVAREGFVEDPTKIGFVRIQITVREKINWFLENFKDSLTKQFSIDASNAAGAPKVKLVVGDYNLGELTSLDLLRLKSIVSDASFVEMLENIPVRSDGEIWNPTDDAEYKDRDVYETPLISGVTRTTEKEEYVLKDPNLDPAHLPANYNAKTSVKSRIVETGDYTLQRFSGEYTQLQKANILKKRSQLLEAIITALKVVNDNEAKTPNLDIDALSKYLFN